MKIGRNDPCPCGSGKKYKRCHLNSQPVKTEMREVKPQELKSFSTKLDRPNVNSTAIITMVPVLQSPYDSRVKVEVPKEGGPGTYKATYVFATPGRALFQTNIDIESFLKSGESLLLMSKDKILKTELFSNPGHTNLIGMIQLIPNEKGELARAEMQLEAANLLDAHKKSYDAVLPLVSWLSAVHDVAIEIVGYQISEQKTGLSLYQFYLIGNPKGITLSDPTSGHISKQEFRALFAAYREALNSNNPFYQFLCYFKVIEGIKQMRIRSQRAQKVPKKLQSAFLSTEVMPEATKMTGVDPWDLALFTHHQEKTFEHLVEEFKPLVRNAVAHLNPQGNSLVIDKFEDVQLCRETIPVIKFMAREMLKNLLGSDPDYSKTRLF